MSKIVKDTSLDCVKGQDCYDRPEASLSQKEEISLAAYVDGECGWIQRIFTKKKLNSSFDARKYVDDLERSSLQISRDYSKEVGDISSDVSLWPRISARIAQEERLSLLRSIPVENNDAFSWFSRFAWSGMGAVTASLLFLVFAGQTPIADKQNIAFNHSQPTTQIASPVSYEENSNYESPRFLNENSSAVSNSELKFNDEELRALQLAALSQRGFYSQSPSLMAPSLMASDRSSEVSLGANKRVVAPQMFEVDWVRAKGRVKVLQDKSGKAAIIWVNRPQSQFVGNR